MILRIIKLCLCILPFALVACHDNGRQNEETRYRFGHIIDIAYTPDADTPFRGGFCDQGAWMGFTLPQKTKWINGFCGPFSLDNRYAMSRSAVVAGFNDVGTETFVPDSVNYFPGEIYLSARSATGTIVQRLQFIDSSTALLCVHSDKKQPLKFTGDGWAKEASFHVNQNTVTIRYPSGEIICIGFAPDARVSCGRENYLAVCPVEKEIYLTLSFFTNEKEKTAGLQKAAFTLEQPEHALKANNERWENYLNAILRSDMPEAYNRVAVKSLVTILSNWKVHKGGLLHEGVVPSHAVGYFMGFWAWDSWRFAVALAPIAPELAKNQIRAMFDYQLPDGMVIDCIYSDPEENNARDSKPPLAAWAVDVVFTHTQDTAFLQEMYPQLLAYHRWWYAKRDHDRNGICEFGSTDGTIEAAAWESGMDNAIRFDNAQMVKNGADAWSFDQESVDLNAYLALDYQLIKKFAKVIGLPFEEPDHTATVAAYFFDNESGFFFDRRLKDRSFVRDEGCEAYTPFWTGIATPEQMKRALVLFTDTTRFATYIPFPTVAADHPKCLPNGYWRGPVWLDQTYFAIKGLRNYGYHDLADQYTRKVFERLQGLTASAAIYENYNARTGECLKAPHFSWSAAHLLMLYQDYGK